MTHRKAVCHAHPRRSHLCPRPRHSCQRSPPSPSELACSRWEHLPPANRRRLLQLLGHLVERQLHQAAPHGLVCGEEEEREHISPDAHAQ